MTRLHRAMLVVLLVFSLAAACEGKPKSKKDQPLSSSLSQFLARVQGQQPAAVTSLGSLWPLEGGPLADLATDYKARRLNDIVIIRIVEQTLAQASGDVTAQRGFSANSAITGAAGQVNTANVNPLYAVNSSSNLKGTGTANSQSLLQSSVAGPRGCGATQR